MTSERDEPALNAGEREMLEGWLDFHRRTLIAKCEGLTDEQLRTASVPPSELTLLGLVRHMAEVERFWFHEVLLDEDLDVLYCSEDDPDGDFHVTEADTWQEAYAAHRAEVDRARRDTAGRSLDELSRRTDRAGKEHFTLRWIYTHMIEEYARHNGHADLIRESIDGVTGE